ncbi:hypothetical protein LSUB1_G003055 [Lachnellula subtilissima]|uniref:Phosphotransferase enzyme family protein n=1 Tax=Lachnellula subtilissima TaxID=602034 RepID=A0A8H8UDD2_9HELO|nr:hypothetical protein LSUB1_G003055 [Lachnellula subtilissima]
MIQTMALKKRMHLMEKVVKIEQTLFGIQFPANGSIFYKDSLEPGSRSVDLPQTIANSAKFSIGPYTEYLWWLQKRHELSVNVGPWASSESSWGESTTVASKVWPTKISPRKFLSRILRTLESRPESGDIMGVIDWQHATILPIFLRVKILRHFQTYGDEDSSNLNTPRLPSNFDTLSDLANEEEMEIYYRRQVHIFYVNLLKTNLYDDTCKSWEGDNTSLQAELINIVQYWPEIVPGGDKPPVQYSAEEVKDYATKMCDFIVVNIEDHGFEEAKQKAKYAQKEMLAEAETEEERKELLEHWLFKDHEEINEA